MTPHQILECYTVNQYTQQYSRQDNDMSASIEHIKKVTEIENIAPFTPDKLRKVMNAIQRKELEEDAILEIVRLYRSDFLTSIKEVIQQGQRIIENASLSQTQTLKSLEASQQEITKSISESLKSAQETLMSLATQDQSDPEKMKILNNLVHEQNQRLERINKENNETYKQINDKNNETNERMQQASNEHSEALWQTLIGGLVSVAGIFVTHQQLSALREPMSAQREPRDSARPRN